METQFHLLKRTILRQVSSGLLPSHIAGLDLSPETRLLDLGIDSLGTMTLLVELQDYLPGGVGGASLPEDGATLGDLAARMLDT
jgi:phosphopantetheine binding protein